MCRPQHQYRRRVRAHPRRAVAKDAALVELYRQAKLTHHQLASALELDRFAVDALLKRHQVTEDFLSAEALGSQIATLRKLVGQ